MAVAVEDVGEAARDRSRRGRRSGSRPSPWPPPGSDGIRIPSRADARAGHRRTRSRVPPTPRLSAAPFPAGYCSASTKQAELPRRRRRARRARAREALPPYRAVPGVEGGRRGPPSGRPRAARGPGARAQVSGLRDRARACGRTALKAPLPRLGLTGREQLPTPRRRRAPATRTAACIADREGGGCGRSRGRTIAMTEDIVILDGARTAIGTFGGSLAAVPPIALAATAAREALARAGRRGRADRARGLRPRDQHRAARHVPQPGGGDGGGGAGQRAGDERQPALRVGGAGDRLLRAGAQPRRRRLRAGRRGGEHVALALCADRRRAGGRRWATPAPST